MPEINYNNLYLKKIIFVFLTISLVLVVGLRPLELFRDSENYLNMLYYPNYYDLIEPTFWLIDRFNRALFNGKAITFFFIYALLGVLLKVIAINRLSKYPFLSLYLYICLYMVLLDMTQIRAGVAAGIFLLAIPDISNKNITKYFLKTVLAISFHYSALMMLFFYFLNPKSINKKIYYLLPLLGLVLAFTKNFMIEVISFITTILPSFVADKINIYLLRIDTDQYQINIFNFFTLSLIIIYYFLLFNLDKIKNDLNITLIKLFALQIFSFYSLSSMPVFSFRISEFIGVSMIILIPNMISLFKQKIFPTVGIMIWAATYFWAISLNTLLVF